LGFEFTKETYSGGIKEITLGQGDKAVTVGGESCYPFYNFEGEMPHKPKIAMEIWDMEPEEWPAAALSPFKDVISDPAAWAKKCVDQFGADLICLKFDAIHPDKEDKDAEHAVKVTKDVLAAVGVPLILWGCGYDDKDNKIMPKVSEAAKGENCLIGIVSEDNYKSLTAIALADGHHLITAAPLDINIAKQVNILVSDMGFPLEKIVTYQATGALGYGIEYVYSIQERQRLAALGGDKMMAMPIICDVGYESWRTKEAKQADIPQCGAPGDRGPMWEAATAVCLLQAGADILRMRHPKAVATVKNFINQLW